MATGRRLSNVSTSLVIKIGDFWTNHPSTDLLVLIVVLAHWGRGHQMGTRRCPCLVYERKSPRRLCSRCRHNVSYCWLRRNSNCTIRQLIRASRKDGCEPNFDEKSVATG